jgi:hypothetical protein
LRGGSALYYLMVLCNLHKGRCLTLLLSHEFHEIEKNMETK